ncbi:NADH dehydrogenase [Streptomyces phaeochromogenes]|jgi:NADH:ubiquinone reductase (H+-translocating)|uniref:NAD(P)/FAD-dependent oxidoreductase n=1 Tax=Streptomyces TaxID=1883 RepID=UPI00117D91C9|nr:MULTISPECIES: NAD(P)/FAD-dependent oxidoreductase [Streptomyces]MDQ0950298.1 NADH dehydrogenase [Streptomyces phaeochromogenes]TRO62649.1 NAD(P)/FAD-dependent oxidoreductase [Streptomyces sp. IB201691-2A2]
MSTTERPRILVVGGGYVGLYAARRILKKMRYGEATVTVVDPRSYMTYQPFLPEAAAGSISPRHVVVPLRRVLPKAEVLTGRVTTIDQDRKVATIAPLVGEAYELPFDYLVIAMGAVSRTFPIPGLAEQGIGMKGIEEAIGLRNHVLEQLDKADSTTDEDVRRKALTFVFVGGGFAGAETIGEVEDMARDAAKYYSNVSREDMRFILVDAADKILPEVGPKLGQYGKEHLEGRGVEVYLSTSMDSCVDGHVVLKNGLEVDSNTIVWTAGVKPNPVLSRFGLPLGPRGHVDTQTTLQVQGTDYVWAAGDNAQVPDLVGRKAGNENAWCPPNAQHALRQARVLGDNVISGMRGFPQKDYSHANKGAVAGLGLHKGVAMIVMGKMKIKLKGRLAWYMHRGYHGLAMPTWNRKIRVFADWTLAMFLKREVVSLGAMETPREEFYEAAKPAPAAAAAKAEPVSAASAAKTEEKAKAS